VTTAQEIKETIESLTKLENAKKHYALLTDSLVQMKNELSEKSIQLSKEQDDIEALEKMSVTALFHQVIGDKDQLLEKERQEYLSLAIKIKALKKSIELSEFEASIVKEKAMASDELIQKLHALKSERLSEIVANNEPSKSSIVNVLHEIDVCHRLTAEMKEPYIAGEEAKLHTQSTLQYLQQAINYGQWDMYGQNNAGYAKHNALDEAARSVAYAQRALQIYNKELLDIGVSDTLLNINVETFSSFTDLFFDNLISDWILQKKIKTTFERVKEVTEKITLIQLSIEKNIAKAEANTHHLEEVRDKIVLEA
jgi:hypothetical protein